MHLYFARPLQTLARVSSALLLVSFAQAAAATPYRFDDLLPAPAAGVFKPRDLNDAGLVVGGYDDGFRRRGFLYQDGFYTTVLGNTGTLAIEPRGVNDAGQVAGYYTDLVLSSYSLGFLLDRGTLSLFNGAEPWGTDIGGINNVGQIVGWNPIGLFGAGFIYTPASHQLARLDGIDLLPADINDAGDLVGRQQYYIVSDDGTFTTGVRAATYEDGSYHLIDVPGAQQDQVLPYGINNAGAVSGSFIDAVGSHGFVFEDGRVSVLDAPGAVPGTTQVFGINNRGQVAGFFVDDEGMTRGFIASPVPEPTSAALMLVGLVGLGLRLRRRS